MMTSAPALAPLFNVIAQGIKQNGNNVMLNAKALFNTSSDADRLGLSLTAQSLYNGFNTPLSDEYSKILGKLSVGRPAEQAVNFAHSMGRQQLLEMSLTTLLQLEKWKLPVEHPVYRNAIGLVASSLYVVQNGNVADTLKQVDFVNAMTRAA